MIESKKIISKNPTFVLNFEYSEKSEVERVKYTLSKYEWFRSQGYNFDLPKTLSSLENFNNLTDEFISRCVTAEFIENEYLNISKHLSSEWQKIKNDFQTKLAALNLPISNQFDIVLTKYGVGGSYNPPHRVIIKITSKRDPILIVQHEIIHLTIERLIQEFKIDHWTKERLVDLIWGKFFPESIRLQRNPENPQKINEIFNVYFPDVNKIIFEISKL